MHIAIILGPFLPVPTVLGGAVEKVHLALARAYGAAGNEVTIVSRQFGTFPHLESIDGVRHVRVRSRDRSRNRLVNLFFSLRYAIRAAAALPRADITITNEFFLPLILRRRTAGKIYVQVGRFPKFQMVLYFRADRLQAVSHAVADAIARQSPWLVCKVRMISYAISDVYFRPMLPHRERIILYVGRIAREKGVELLVKAFLLLKQRCEPYSFKSWKIRIVGPHTISQGGDGEEYLAELKELARAVSAQCEFVGPIFDQNCLIDEYSRSSIFVYPSLAEFGESFGLAPLEAMACGCAAIVSDLRCFDDFLEHEVTGLKFDHRAQPAENNLATELGRLLMSPDLLARVALAGRDAAAQFRTEPIADQMLTDFAALLGR